MSKGNIGKQLDSRFIFGSPVNPQQKKRCLIMRDFVNGKPGRFQRLRRWFK